MVNELYHYGIKGQKWGVRRFQKKDGTLTSVGKKRHNNDRPEVITTGNDRYEQRQVKYTNNKNTNGKIQLDKWYENDDYYEGERFDDALTTYARNMRQRGKDAADRILHDTLKDYSYSMLETTYNSDGEQYAEYSLQVFGNKSYYTVAGTEDYTDEQYFLNKNFYYR